MADNAEIKQNEHEEYSVPRLSIKDQVGRTYVPFEPQEHGLDANFLLTKYGCNRERGAKPNHHDLQSLLMTFLNSQVLLLI